MPGYHTRIFKMATLMQCHKHCFTECAESGVQRKVNFLSVHQLSMANQPPRWPRGARGLGPGLGTGLAGLGLPPARSESSLAGSGLGPSGVEGGLHEMLLGDGADGVSKEKGGRGPWD